MSKRLVPILAAMVVLAFIGAYAASPYWAVRSFVAAARSGDAARLNDAIDFPAVRKSLKPQMTEALTGQPGGDVARPRRNPLGGLGRLLAPVIVDQALDTLVTPESIAQLVRHGDARSAASPVELKPTSRPLGYSYSYIGLDRFRVTLISPDHPEWPAQLIFERRNLFWWALVRLNLPKDILAGHKLGAAL